MAISSLIITTSGLLFILALAGDSASGMPVSPTDAATTLDRAYAEEDCEYAGEAYTGLVIFNAVARKALNISINFEVFGILTLSTIKLSLQHLFITCKLHTCTVAAAASANSVLHVQLLPPLRCSY